MNYREENMVIDVSLLSKFGEFVECRLGLHFPDTRKNDLRRGIVSAAKDLGFENAESCMKFLLSSSLEKRELETLSCYLTVGETYFLRDKESFAILEKQILPELIRSRRGRNQEIRIWSAGCSTGEEPYTIAMIIDHIIPDPENWKITILATDINTKSLLTARDGMYGEWSFRNAPEWLKEKYFKKTKSGYDILPHIKNRVTCLHHNLAEDPFPPIINNITCLDIIFCRNVLMYLTPDQSSKIVHRLHGCLSDEGWLFISPVDTCPLINSLFEAVCFPDAITYRKISARKPESCENTTVTKMEEIKTNRHTHVEPANRRHTGKKRKTIKKEQIPFVVDALPSQAVRARVFADQGNLSDALALCEEAISSDKLNPSLHYLRATILQEMGMLQDAVKSLEKAIYSDRTFVIAHFTLGNVLRTIGKDRESDKILKNTLRLLHQNEYNDILPESDGITAGRLIEVITKIMRHENS
jgi:chemotaxis protein methyltransferase CheR